MDRYDPKFDPNATYSRDDFIFRLEALIATILPGDPVLVILKSNLEWANKHPKGTIFGWRFAKDRTLVPYADVSAGIYPVASE